MERERYSFAETAAEIGCLIGDLRRECESRGPADSGKHRGIPVTSFDAIEAVEYWRILQDMGRAPVGGTVPEEPGFPGFYAAELVKREVGRGTETFEARLSRLLVRPKRLSCLTAEGHMRVLADLKHLADDRPPVTGAVAVAEWRQSRAARRQTEEIASREAAPLRRPPSPDHQNYPRRTVAMVDPLEEF